MKDHYLLIPVELCKLALSNRKVKEVALWIYLKSISSGHFLLKQDLIKKVSEAIGYKSIKTFKKHLNWLIKAGWITLNRKSGSHRIISFSQLARKCHFKSKKSAIFNVEKISTIKGFFAGAVITYNLRRTGQSAFQRHEAKKYCPYPFVTNKRLMKFLEVPRSTAQRFKKEAISDGYIDAEHKYDITFIPTSDYDFIKKNGGEMTKNLLRKNNRIWEQKPDKIKSLIVLRNKAK